MERKTIIEISLAIFLLLLFVGGLLWWKSGGSEEEHAIQPSNTAHVSGSSVSTGSNAAPSAPTPVVTIKETSSATVARTFIERLGSYSTEADAENIDDILSMATASFQAQLRSLAAQARTTEQGSYYGISTVVLTTPKIVSTTETRVVLSMTTQREETIDEPGNTTVKNQDITITLVKSGTTWLVDGYEWE